MNLNQLRMFESVAKHLNMTRAAEELHVSQPAISQQLKLLEIECSAKFYVKTSQGMDLTEQGQAFLDAIRPILIEVENVERTFAVKRDRREKNRLAVGGTHGLCASVLPKILMAFKLTHPRVRLLLETNDSRTLERRILKSEVEIALITNPSHLPEIELQPYIKQKVVAFVPAVSPLAKKQIILGELSTIPLVVRKDGKIERVLVERGYQSNIAIECENSEAVKAAVRMGMGVGIIYRDAVEREVQKGELKVIHIAKLPRIAVRSFIAYNKHGALSAVAQDFLRTLHESRTPGIESTTRKASVA